MGSQKDDRYDIFCKLIDVLDEGVEYIRAYDEQLHDYQGVILYQAESQVIKSVGDHPGITVSELAKGTGKTSSAFSQLIRKLRGKDWIRQERNEDNNRIYNLYLTEEGQKIYEGHKAFENRSYQRSYHMLDDFSVKEMQTYMKIQSKLNESFRMDVEESRLSTGMEHSLKK